MSFSGAHYLSDCVSACGYAALTLMPDDAEVLTVELKVNLLAPASGNSVVAEGEVVRAGRTLTARRGDAYAEQGAERVHVATIDDDGASARGATGKRQMMRGFRRGVRGRGHRRPSE